MHELREGLARTLLDGMGQHLGVDAVVGKAAAGWHLQRQMAEAFGVVGQALGFVELERADLRALDRPAHGVRVQMAHEHAARHAGQYSGQRLVQRELAVIGQALCRGAGDGLAHRIDAVDRIAAQRAQASEIGAAMRFIAQQVAVTPEQGQRAARASKAGRWRLLLLVRPARQGQGGGRQSGEQQMAPLHHHQVLRSSRCA